MENYENQEFAPEQEPFENPPQNQAEQYEYRGSGAGRKESPFADSPYVMEHEQPRQHYQPQYEAPKKPRKKKKNGVGKKILACALSLAVVAGSCGITAALVNDYWDGRMDHMEEEFHQQIRDLQNQISKANTAGNSVSGTAVSNSGLNPGQVYAQNVHSVVLITSQVTGTVYGQTTTGVSSGSGFILSEDGYVITNAHVVEGASSVEVTTYNGDVYTAQIKGTDTTNDVALLKVEATGLDAVAVGTSADLIVGDQVVAIGNPLGDLTSTMTVGYVSAKDRDVTTDGVTINMIQTDAAINSGNSGGPLFNMKGEVVGITTAKYSGSSSSGATIEGIGFAIPIDDAMNLVEDLMEFGYVKGAYMGVVIRDMDSQTAALAQTYGLPVGPIILSTEAGGAAEQAGLQANDIVTKVGETRVETVAELTRALRDFEPGDTTTITVFRSTQTLELEITFDERPADAGTTTTQPQETAPQQTMPNEGSIEDWLNPFFGWGN